MRHGRLTTALVAMGVGALVSVPLAVTPAAATTEALPFDFNGDGQPELAVGVPGEDIGSRNAAGAVHVFPGTASGPSVVGDQFWSQSRPGVRGAAERSDRFGSVLASGDFDADGFADLAIGVPGESIGGRSEAGAVQVLYGTAAGLRAAGDQLWHQGTAGVPGANESGDRFGWSLAVGDFEGDGYADLAIGVPREGIGDIAWAGRVVVLRGSATGLTATGASSWSQATPGIDDEPEPFEGNFGLALAAGDVTADGRDDLAIGAHSECVSPAVGSGAVHLVPGSADGLTATGSQFVTGLDVGISTVCDEGGAGSVLAMGDVDADGHADLALGNRFGGGVALLPGASTGLVPADATLWDLDVRALAAGDVTADGIADLVVGATGSGGGAVVQVLAGSPAGLAATDVELSRPAGPGLPDAAASGFGDSLAVLARAGSRATWLAVGAPTDSPAGRLEAGTVTALPSTAVGPDPAAAVVLHQGTAGVKGAPERFDALGRVAGYGGP
jgi:hypothetical protein